MAWNWIDRLLKSKTSTGASSVRKTPVTALAVLPFKNLNHNEDLTYFSDGIAEEIINYLSSIEGLRVISRNSTRRLNKFQDLHEIVQKATLGKVIQGSISRSDDRMKLNVELIDFGDQHTIWSDNYDTSLEKIGEVLAEVIVKVLNELNVSSAGKRHNSMSKDPVSFEVYDLYLKARYQYNQREGGLKLGADLFASCVKMDPKYARAYAGLSQCYTLLGFYEFNKPSEVYHLAKENAVKALEIDNSLVEAHTAFAFVHTLYDWNWTKAEQEFRTALELNPGYVTVHHWYAELLLATGRFEEGIQQARKAQKCDPVGLIINTLLGMAYFLASDFERSIAECKKTLMMSPNYLPAYIWLGLSYCKSGMYDEAIVLYEKGRAISKNKNSKMTSLLAYSYALAGKAEDAESIVSELDVIAKFSYVSPIERAAVDTGLGNIDAALKHLEDAYEERATGLTWLNINPIFDSLRTQSRFQTIISKMNYPQ